MNKFYYIEGDEIKELNTVKDFDFIKKKVNKKAVEKKKDLKTPEGYIIKNNKIEPTTAKQKELDDLAIEQEKEVLIQAKIRELAIEALEKEGKLNGNNKKSILKD